MMMVILVVYVIAFLVDKYLYIMAGPVNVPTKNESSSIIDLNAFSQAVDGDFWISSLNETTPMDSYGVDTIKVWNHSNSSGFIVVLECTSNSIVLYRKSCLPLQMIGYDFNVVSGPESPTLKFSLYKMKSISTPLVEPIEVAIPMPDSDVCLVIYGTYATAMKEYVPCARPVGIRPATQTPQGSNNITYAMPLYIPHSPVPDRPRAPNGPRP